MEYSTLGRKQEISAEGVIYNKGSVYDRLHKLQDMRKARGSGGITDDHFAGKVVWGG
jgi:hypothetical protein